MVHMELGQYVSDLQRQLVDAAANGTDDMRAVAVRLASGLDAATRLVLLDALSTAAEGPTWIALLESSGAAASYIAVPVGSIT